MKSKPYFSQAFSSTPLSSRKSLSSFTAKHSSRQSTLPHPLVSPHEKSPSSFTAKPLSSFATKHSSLRRTIIVHSKALLLSLLLTTKQHCFCLPPLSRAYGKASLFPFLVCHGKAAPFLCPPHDKQHCLPLSLGKH